MANILQWLSPKEDKFFDLLKAQADATLEAASALHEMIQEYDKLSNDERKEFAKKIKAIEHKGDDAAHTLFEQLNKTFITPLDRDDIHHLANFLDDVTDLINAVALRLVILEIRQVDEHIEKLVNIVHSAVKEIHIIMSQLKTLKQVKEHTIKINTLENEADDVYHDALSKVFKKYNNPIDIIKYKEIYEFLEDTTDRCEHVANVIENIVMKHA